MAHKYKFAITDVFGNDVKCGCYEYKILKFVDKANENGYKDKLYLYLKLARMIVNSFHKKNPRPIPLYGISDLYKFMDKYYYDDRDNELILNFILFVYHQYHPHHGKFKDNIWSAFSEHMLIEDHCIDVARELNNISIMRYRAHSSIAESEIRYIISSSRYGELAKERYRKIVDIVRKCVNDEYDLSKWIEKKYTTQLFGNKYEERNDPLFKIYCPTDYNPYGHTNFKLLRENIDIDRSKKILVNTVLIELKVLIDLRIDIEHENEIHDAINAIRRDKKMRTYILPSTRMLLDKTCEFFTAYSKFTHLGILFDKNSNKFETKDLISITDFDESMKKMLRGEGIELYRYLDRDDSGKAIMRYNRSDKKDPRYLSFSSF